ncbi:MFS transporter [Streptomyces qinglanensis]|uniref:Major Facilitator Superfamily protein n=1 Tax=Streptomyces qinglanensis TaxID=943816 RepID=A0A1H9P2H3_9ACTN|nr:MFS transporter [Streptomyces qinglanensis]SER42267.1 Major Facilitator Superfamily protein [Streptomyces qinglanensis]
MTSTSSSSPVPAPAERPSVPVAEPARTAAPAPVTEPAPRSRGAAARSLSKAHATDSGSVPGGGPVPGSASGPGSGPAPVRRGPRPGWLLAIVLTGQFMALLDTFIVNVAAPDLRADLHASGAGLQLVIAGYTLAYAVLLITGARLGALLGHARMFLCGLALFTGASLACGLATGTGWLIAFRLAQGAGGAVMLPQVLSLIQRTFTGAARSRALGGYAAVLGVGAAAGQLLGGVLVSADLFGWGWRPVFLINVPVGAALLVAGPRLLRVRTEARGGSEERRALDLPGLVLLGALLLLFTVPVVLGREQGWPLWGWVSLALCAALVPVFGRYELLLSRRGGRPLVSPLVLRAPGVPLAVVRIFCMMAVNAGFVLVVMLHLQTGLGKSALFAGVSMVPTAGLFALVGMVWRRLPQSWHPRLSATGFLAAAASFGWLGTLLSGGGDGGPWLYVCLSVSGMGLSLAYNPVLSGALARVRQSEAADASGLLVTTAQLGLLSGVALFGAVFLEQAESAPVTPAHSAHALALTCAALAAVSLAAAAAGALSGAVRRVGGWTGEG